MVREEKVDFPMAVSIHGTAVVHSAPRAHGIGSEKGSSGFSLDPWNQPVQLLSPPAVQRIAARSDPVIAGYGICSRGSGNLPKWICGPTTGAAQRTALVITRSTLGWKKIGKVSWPGRK